LAERRANGFNNEVIEHDLLAENLSVLEGELFSDWRRGAENPSERARKVVALSDRLIAELKANDLVVIDAPMYSLNVPTHLKNLFDLVARAVVISSRGVCVSAMEPMPLPPICVLC